jgi:hypothetical protein
MHWQNEQIAPEKLPSYADLNFSRVQLAYKNVMLAEGFLYWLILAVIAGISMYFVKPPADWLIVLGIIFSLFLLTIILTSIKSFYNMGYALREHDIVFRKGWLFENIYLIPIRKIQHISVKRGPLERANGLASLKLFTAGGVGADVTLSGLLHADALQLKEWISGRQKPLQNPHEHKDGTASNLE